MFHKNDFRVFALLIIFLPASTLFCQTVGSPATFAGQVMDRLSGRPLAGVEVSLSRAAQVSPLSPADSSTSGAARMQEDEITLNSPFSAAYSATSGPDGRFVINGIVPGEYFVSPERHGYAGDDPERGSDKGSLPRHFAQGESVRSVLFMVPRPIITGRVLDSKGAPMEKVDVHAIGTEGSQYAPTDDRGEFRMVMNRPGTCLIKVEPDKHFPSEIRRDGTTPVVYGLTYFPSSRLPASAEWVTTQFGKESFVEIKLQPAPAAHISGTVSGMSPGERAELRLQGPEKIRTLSDQEGRFTLWRVPAGRYHLQATVDRWSNPKAHSSHDEQPLSSRQIVLDVGATAIEGINLEVTPPVTLTLKFRGGDWQKYKNKMEDVSFGLRGEDVNDEKSPDGNGELRHDKLKPGSYHVVVDGLPEDLYVKALHPSQGEATRNIIEVGRTPEQEVEIELGTDGAEISGVIRNKAGEATEAEVFLLDDEDPDLPEVQTTTTEKDGHYEFDGVAPGKYRLLAHDKEGALLLRLGIPGQYQGIIKNPEVKELFRTAMEKIEVSSGSKATKDLKIW